MSTFPGGVWSPPTRADAVDDVVAADFNTPAGEIVAIQTELGTDPSGSFSTVKDRIARAEAIGAEIKRVSTSTVNTGSGQRTMTGYDTSGQVDAGFTVNHAAGTITVPSNGWYSCEAHARLSVAATDYFQVIIGDATTVDRIRGTAVSALILDAETTGTIYVTAGTALRASVFTGTSTSLVGNASGNYYYFRVVRL